MDLLWDHGAKTARQVQDRRAVISANAVIDGRVTARDIDGVTTRSFTGGRFRSQGGAAEGPVAKLETTNGSIEVRKR